VPIENHYSLQMSIERFKCCLCLKQCSGFGHNPDPLITKSSAECCGKCSAVVNFVRMYSRGENINTKNWITLIRTDSKVLDLAYKLGGYV